MAAIVYLWVKHITPILSQKPVVGRAVMVFLVAILTVLPAQSAQTPPRPEHPRPDFRRDDWLNLNGDWQFRFDPQDRGLQEGWQEKPKKTAFDRRITVPFPWRSLLSGVQTTDAEGNIGWYRRCAAVPESFRGKRVWLCFTGIGGEARIWANGKLIGDRRDASAPFEFDVTAAAPAGEELCIVVRVAAAGLSSGRGIWQTVWLEARPALYIRAVRAVPRLEGEIWSLGIDLEIAACQEISTANVDENSAGREIRVEFSSPRGEFPQLAVPGKISAENGAIKTKLTIPSPLAWSPQRPKLYDLDIRLSGKEGSPPDAVHTYFALRVLEQKKSAADAARIFLLNGRPLYLRGAFDQPFNPQGFCTAPDDRFMRRDMEIAKSLGLNVLLVGGRAVEPRRRYWADRTGLLLLDELPPLGDDPPPAKEAWEAVARACARDDCEMSLNFRDFTTRLRRHATIGYYAFAQLADAERSRNGLLRFDRSPKDFGYDAFVPGMSAADLQGGDFVGIDIPDIMEASARERYNVPIFVSHFSQQRHPPILHWRIVGMDNLGQTVETATEERPVVWRHCEVVFQEPLEVSIPTFRPFVGALVVELLDGRGERLAANYINLGVSPVSTKALPNGRLVQIPRSPRVEILGPRRVALRFSPDDFSAFAPQSPAGKRPEPDGKFIGFGSCNVEYRIAIPDFVREAVPAGLILMAELATKRDAAPSDPRADAQTHPGRIAVRLFDARIWNLDVPDAPSDSRGVLSRQDCSEQGSYGYLVRRKLDLTRLAKLREDIRDKPVMTLSFAAVGKDDDGKAEGAGIAIFGENAGRYPIDPTIIIETARDITPQPSPTSTDPVAVERLLDGELQKK